MTEKEAEWEKEWQEFQEFRAWKKAKQENPQAEVPQQAAPQPIIIQQQPPQSTFWTHFWAGFWAQWITSAIRERNRK